MIPGTSLFGSKDYNVKAMESPFPHLRKVPVFSLVLFFAFPATCQTGDLKHHLRDQYQGKTLLLRGFYSGEKLHYDSKGALIGGATPGDWTADGFVVVTDLQLSKHRLAIKARRLMVVSEQREFRFLAETARKPAKKAPIVKIEAELDTAQHADSAISRLFLTPEDDFPNLVPDYWKPCVAAGLLGKDANCHFSHELQTIPGLGFSKRDAATGSLPQERSNNPVSRLGQGISPPKAISQPEPEFSDRARQAKYQGTTTLGLIVSKEGLPTSIRVVNPLGGGLDARAVEAVERWRFNPAQKDGQPVAVEIMVEVDFHLY